MDSCTGEKINYRELQAIAKKLRLPGNLKYHLLLEVVEARKQGNEGVVQRILAEQKVERAKRRSEKLEGREAAYKHLQIPQEKRPLGRPRKHPQPESVEKLSTKQRSASDSYLRSLLAMPAHSIDQLIRQTGLPAPDNQTDPLHDPRNQRDLYTKQIGPENYDAIDNTQQESYQPNLMAGCSVKDYSQFVDCMGKNVSFDTNNQYLNNSSRNFEGMNNVSYLEGWNKPSDHWRSFQMRDILANNSNNVIPQYYTYPDGYTGGTGQNDYSPQYVQDVSNILLSNQKQMSMPYHHSAYPPTQNYWRGMWEEGSQDHYWRHFQNPVNSYQLSSNRGIFPDMPAGYSPSSDTMSATEQEFESLIHSHEPTLPDIKPNNQMSYPLIYSYVALGEGQGICQLPSETEIPAVSFHDQTRSVSGQIPSVVQSEVEQSVSNVTECSISERACSLSNLFSTYCLSPSILK